MASVATIIFLITVLVLLLSNYRSGILTTLLVITNFGEFVYVNPNLEVGDFGGVGNIFFMDLFWTAMIIVLIIKRNRFYFFRYKLSFAILAFLFATSLIIPFLISSYSLKDAISSIRPLGNFLLLPYFVIMIRGIKEFNYLEKLIVYASLIFVIIQLQEYSTQQRIPIRLFERDSVFFGENPFSVEFAGIKTGYIWSRIGYLLPFNLFFGAYYYFSERRNYGLMLIGIYILSIMISLSRIWIIGFGFFLIVISFFLISNHETKQKVFLKLVSLIGFFAITGAVLVFTSDSFHKILDIFLLRINSINDLADKTDSSFLGREYILMQMFSVWNEYPIFGAGFSSISRRLITNDLGLPNIMTIFGGAGISMMTVFIVQFFRNIRPFAKQYYILFSTLAAVLLMIVFMSLFSIDMFYFNATGAMMLSFGNILYNIGMQKTEEYEQFVFAV